MAEPTQKLLLPAIPAPPAPTVSSEAEWLLLSDEARALAIFQFQTWWMGRTPALYPSAPCTVPIVIPVPPVGGESSSTEGANPAPTAEQLASFRDERWKKY